MPQTTLQNYSVIPRDAGMNELMNTDVVMNELMCALPMRQKFPVTGDPSVEVERVRRCTLSCHLKTTLSASFPSGRSVRKLECAMSGTRDAPMAWQDHLRKTQLNMKLKSLLLIQVCFNMRLEIFFSACMWMICCAQVHATI